jgi:hypothetical protein
MKNLSLQEVKNVSGGMSIDDERESCYIEDRRLGMECSNSYFDVYQTGDCVRADEIQYCP